MPQSSISLPEPISRYFAADKTDGEAVAQCFSPDATVIDEGQSHQGRAAIVKWREDAVTKYTYTSKPFAMDSEGGRTLVTSRLEGNFPGSPIDLTYAFTLDGDAIAKLEIGI